MDFVTQLPVSTIEMEKYNAILIVVDRYTKMTIFLSIMDIIDVAEIAKLLYKEVELRYDYSSKIVFNRDPKITSKF